MADLPELPGVLKVRREAWTDAQSSDSEQGGAVPPQATDWQNASHKGGGKTSAAAEGAASSASPIKMLENSDWDVRHAAVEVLGKLKRAETLSAEQLALLKRAEGRR